VAARGHHTLLMVGSQLPEMEGLALIRSLRQEVPEADVIVVARELEGPTRGRAATDLVRQCIAEEVLDIIGWPVQDAEAACEQIRTAVRRNVDRQMRAHVLRQIRGELDQVAEEARQEITASLEHRLGGLRRWIGDFDHALVGEGTDPALRALSENLLVSGMVVEAADTASEAWARIEEGGLHLAVLDWKESDHSLPEALEAVRAANPLGELLVAARVPRLGDALDALRAGVALYIPWPPADGSLLVKRIQRIRQKCRRERLLDGLLAALFLETHQGAEQDPAAYGELCELAGIERRPPREALIPAADGPAGEVGDGVVEQILDPGQTDLPEVAPPALAAVDIGEHERRAHQRVLENQFVRFRPGGAMTSTLAYLGDISEGGLFVRSDRVPSRGDPLQVDVNIEHEGLGYLVRCQGEVAWVAQDTTRVAYGPGFGVRFIDPPQEVTLLLQRVVDGRRE
jgi:DNA-binding NarL/FixJ family response regulator/Tfp pilus assembly protein PilZ